MNLYLTTKDTFSDINEDIDFLGSIRRENYLYEEAIVNFKNLRNERIMCVEEG